MYRASIPVGDFAFRDKNAKPGEKDKIYIPWLPYFVTAGALKSEAKGTTLEVLVVLFGALLHVGSWFLAFIFDILMVVGLKPDDDVDDKKAYEFWWLAFAPFCTGFAVVLLNLVYHIGKYCMGQTGTDGAENDLTPTAVMLLKGGLLISSVFVFLLVQMDHTELAKASEGAFASDFRGCAMVSLACKLYIMSAIEVNQNQALKSTVGLA